MKTTACFTAIALVTLTGVANAADVVRPVPVPAVVAPYDWTGHYIGVDAGFLWGDTVVRPEVTGGHISGPVVGPLVGANFRHDNLIWGIEGDWNWTHADGNGEVLLDTYRYDLDWTAHLRARIGIPHDNLLFFAAGGLALAGFDVTEVGLQRAGGVYTGFTLGAGVDAALHPGWVGRAEVLYDDFGSKQYSDYSAHLTAWTARVALIYRTGATR
jgi:opacity protein-like surface antigen